MTLDIKNPLALLVCPSCGAKHPVEHLVTDLAGRRSIALAGKVPPEITGVLFSYLALFVPSSKYALTFNRLEKLLVPLVQDLQAGQISYSKRQWPVSLAQWESALRSTTERRHSLSLPLSNHNYLYKILAGSADQQEAVAEAKAMAGLATRQPGSTSPIAPSDIAGQARVKAVQALAGEIASTQRTRSIARHPLLRAALISQGHPPDAVDFALARYQKAHPEAIQP